MQIKMNQAKNVYGTRVASGVVMEVGKDIPNWQAEKFIQTGIAVEVAAKPKKAKSK